MFIQKNDNIFLNLKKQKMKSLLTFVFLFFFLSSMAQTTPIKITDNFFTGTRYYQNEVRLEKAAVKKIIASNTEAYTLVSRGMGQQTLSITI